MKAAQLAALCFICLLGIMPVAASAQPYTISSDGSEVTDQKTGLIWRRCAEGMAFSGGTCTGTASTFTHEAALQQATAQAGSTSVAWRLPNVKELASITDKTLFTPAIDPTAFPAIPALATQNFWSSSPYISATNNCVVNGCASLVRFYDGNTTGTLRSYAAYVLLVRGGQ